MDQETIEDSRVYKMLLFKWRLIGDDMIDMEKMMNYYKMDRESLMVIINYFEEKDHTVKFKIK